MVGAGGKHGIAVVRTCKEPDPTALFHQVRGDGNERANIPADRGAAEAHGGPLAGHEDLGFGGATKQGTQCPRFQTCSYDHQIGG